MEFEQKYKILFLKEVRNFLKTIPDKSAKKILFNATQVSMGAQDKELFKKLEGANIWEF